MYALVEQQEEDLPRAELELLAQFRGIAKAYANYHHQPDWAAYLNRYFTNRAYPDFGYCSQAAQDFITVLDAVSLIDHSGKCITAIDNQLTLFTAFSSEDQKKIVDIFYDFFINLQQEQAESLRTRKIAIETTLKQVYSSEFLPQPFTVWLSQEIDQAFDKPQPMAKTQSYSAIPTNDAHSTTASLLQDFVLQDFESADTTTEAPAKLPLKFTYDLKLFVKQWYDDGTRITTLLKAFKKKINHLADTLGTTGPRLQRAELNDTPLWQNPYELSIRNTRFSSLEKQAKRDLQLWHWRYGTTSAAIIGVGEGLVAVTGLSGKTAIPPLVIMLIVGLSGWYINYLLFRGDIRGCLDEFRIKKTLDDNTIHRRIFLNQDNTPLSWGQIASISSFGFACLAVGLVFGALSFVSSKEQLPILFEELYFPFQVNALGLSILAATPAISVGVGFTAIFLRTIIEGIKNEQWQDIGTLLHSLKHPAWQEMTGSEKSLRAYHAMLKALMMALTITITGLVAYFSFPVFNEDCRALIAMLGDAGMAGPALAFIATLTNNIVSVPFQIRAPYNILNGWITTEQAFSTLSQTEQKMTASPLQNINHRIEKLKIFLALLTGLINAVGQGYLFMDNRSIDAMVLSFLMTAAFSFFPNLYAAMETISRHHDHLHCSENMPNSCNSSFMSSLGVSRSASLVLISSPNSSPQFTKSEGSSPYNVLSRKGSDTSL